MKPGIYTNAQLSSDAYHSSAGISKSGLDAIARSPLHYFARYLDDSREPHRETPAMLIGKAFHKLLGEPDTFKSEFTFAPSKEDYPHAVSTIEDITRYASEKGITLPKAKKDAMWEALKAADPEAVLWEELKERIVCGKSILTVDQWDKIHRMRDAVMNHPAAKVLLQTGNFEQSHYWNHSDIAGEDGEGELCKCRPDFIRNDGVIVDFKTCEDASPEAFRRSAWNYRYHVQAAFYLDGVRASDPNVGPFVFLAIEKEPPYAVAVYEADPEMLTAGRIEYMRNLATYSESRKAQQWPGYPRTIQPLGIPNWARKELSL